MKYSIFLGSMLLAGAVALVGVPGVSDVRAEGVTQVAQGSAGAAIKKRISLMKSMSKTRKALRKAAKAGKIGAKNVAQAKKISAITKQLGDKALWPKGSDEGMHKTRAKADIWKDMGKFDRSMAKLQKGASAALAAATSGDAKGVDKGLGAMGCGGCHKPFRGKKKK
jgi:cytochrome c556